MPNAFPQADVLSVGQLLEPDKWYYLPWFQRPYSWHRAHAQQLVSDLVDALAAEGGPHGYLLNVIIIARPPAHPENAIVDGHQRLLSLTILTSILRDLLNRHIAEGRAVGKELHTIVRRLSSAIAETDGTKTRYRLRSQDSVEEVLKGYVQDEGTTLQSSAEGEQIEDEAARRIVENRDAMLEMLHRHAADPDWLAALAGFLLDECRFVVAVFEDEDAAWAAAQRDEQRGLHFHSSDICKAGILTRVPVEDREACAREWEHWQGVLGADNMRSLIGYMRILDGHPASKLPEDIAIIRDSVDASGGTAFIRQKLVPNARRFHGLLAGRASTDTGSGDRSPSIVYLGWLDRNEWLLAALPWLEHDGDRTAEESVTFFRSLERLAYVLRLSGVDPGTQRARFQRIARHVREGRAARDIDELDVGPSEIRKLRETLMASNIGTRRPEFRKIVLRRLNAAIADDDWNPDVGTMTVEHILPKGLKPNNPWYKRFGGKARIEASANMLGNLVPLEIEFNLDLGQAPFSEKRPFLAKSRFALAREAASYDDWDRKTIETRTRRLIDRLLADWT